jgi:predicted RNase H-like nuclease (RuvC/YqgF family)
MQTEIETLRNQIVALSKTSEENTRRISELDSEKLNFEQENSEKDRQIIERDEKIQELQLNLEKTQESGAKLRKALHKMKETITNNEQTHNQESGKNFHLSHTKIN